MAERPAEHEPKPKPVTVPQEHLAPQRDVPIVDPSPTAPPIMLGDTEYKFPPAAASPDDVLALEPNRAEDATDGPHPQISQTAYVHMQKPDGTEFLSPLSNVPYYEAKGYTAGAEEEIPDLVAYNAELAAPKGKRTRGEHAEAPKAEAQSARR